MTGQDDYPAPDEYAAQFRPDDIFEEEAGVHRDQLADAQANAHQFQHLVSEMVVHFNHICDDRGLLPDEMRADLREQQAELRDLSEWLDEFSEALGVEYEQVTEEIQDDD